MKENKQPIFKSIFGSSWSKLPIVIQKHYANRPYSNDVVTVKGKMDIEFNWFGKLCAPLFRIFGTLIPYQGKNIETTVHYKSSKTDNSFSFDRILHFPNKKPFYLRSKMVPIKGKKVIEYMGFGFGDFAGQHALAFGVSLQIQKAKLKMVASRSETMREPAFSGGISWRW